MVKGNIFFSISSSEEYNDEASQKWYGYHEKSGNQGVCSQESYF